MIILKTLKTTKIIKKITLAKSFISHLISSGKPTIQPEITLIFQRTKSPKDLPRKFGRKVDNLCNRKPTDCKKPNETSSSPQCPEPNTKKPKPKAEDHSKKPKDCGCHKKKN